MYDAPPRSLTPPMPEWPSFTFDELCAELGKEDTALTEHLVLASTTQEGSTALLEKLDQAAVNPNGIDLQRDPDHLTYIAYQAIRTNLARRWPIDQHRSTFRRLDPAYRERQAHYNPVPNDPYPYRRLQARTVNLVAWLTRLPD